MLRVVTGPFHPHLEEALALEIARLKGESPRIPLTVVVPSETMRRRIKWLLCVERGGAFLNLHVVTFHQLALRLLEEAGFTNSPDVQSDFFFRELIHSLLRSDDGTSPQWRAMAEMPGHWAALWSTIKDVKDAAVDPERLIELLTQAGPALEASVGRELDPLLRLLRSCRVMTEHLGVGDPEDQAARASQHVAASAFLGSQRRILYYGFYDLTQVQLDLFQAVARSYPVTLYFPLVMHHPAYAFAERFFTRYIQGMLAGDDDWVRAPVGVGDSPAVFSSLFAGERPGFIGSRPACRIVGVAGRRDEVALIAKEILGLIEERGYAFHEIGVVARTLGGYESVLPRTFEEHGIPFASTLGRPLAVFPYVKTVVQILELRRAGFRRDLVMDLLASPFIRLGDLCPAGIVPRLDYWDLISRRLGLTSGIEDWGRLRAFADGGLPLREDEDDGEDTGTGPRIPAAQVRALWSAVSSLADRVSELPETAGWEEYVAWTRRACSELLSLNPVRFAESSIGRPRDGADEVVEAFETALETLSSLGRLGTRPSYEDFLSAFRRLVEESIVPIEAARASERGAGVQVLDAMEARGLAFKALFVMGLNEKVFPRHIREDAFLRDATRRMLEADLGFKTPEKIAGYDEEKLLFHLLGNAARDELVLVYRRSDDAGRPQIPSSYLEEVRRLSAHSAELLVPRRFTDKVDMGTTPYHQPDRLTPVERGVLLLLQGRVPRRLLSEVYRQGPDADRSLTALRVVEAKQTGLTPHDGLAGSSEARWSMIKERGVSPTSLEDYGKCPFRYFARHVLRLEPVIHEGRLGQPDQLTAQDLGILAHRILRRSFEILRDEGKFAGREGLVTDFAGTVRRSASEVFERYARSNPVGYPLLWELHREELVEFMLRAVEEDLKDLADGDGAGGGEWSPAFFEVPVRGSLSVTLQEASPQAKVELPLSGRLDRVDWSAGRGTYRVIDYKYKAGRTQDTVDKNLPLGAARGLRLQPPLYVLLSRDSIPGLVAAKGDEPPRCESVMFYYLAPQWQEKTKRALTRATFPGDAWVSPLQPYLEDGLSRIIAGIRAGRFFIFPDGYCNHCDYRLLCRRTHPASLRRAERDHTVSGSMRTLRRVTPAAGKADDD